MFNISDTLPDSMFSLLMQFLHQMLFWSEPNPFFTCINTNKLDYDPFVIQPIFHSLKFYQIHPFATTTWDT